MPFTLPPITLTENQTSLVNIPGNLGSVTYLKMVNASPYLLSITNLLGGSDYMQPGEANVWPVPGLTTAVQVTPQQFVSPVEIPSSVLVVTWYLEGEQPNGNYPVNFNLLTFNGGNIGVASSIVNDTNSSGTQIIESRPTGAAGPYYLVTNDGNVTMRGALTIAFATGLLPPNVQLRDNGNDLALAIGGLAGPGAYGGFGFSVISNGNAVTPFGIAQSPGVSPLSWIDAAGVLHATAPVTLAAGNQETGAAGFRGGVNSAGDFFGGMVNFKTIMTNVPTSITLAATIGTQNIGVAATASQLTTRGFLLQWGTSTASNTFWLGTYTTVGNCLLAVDGAAGTFDHHCEACGHVSTRTPLSAITHATQFNEPVMSYRCPACDATECFNTSLTAADESDLTPQGSGAYATTRGAQATLIRQLMTALGLEVAS